ncbi:MAG: GYD domain-containing protein [Proteobacteria bacterium]|nr:GYD domain-containing protein [Pseudomonadota bacterium]
MAIYVMLSSLTPEGSKTLHARPERLEEVNREIEEFGCKIVAQYAVLGPYDFVTIVEAADNETVAHLSVDLASRGTVEIQTLPASPLPDLVKKLKGVQQIGKR